MFLNEDLIIYWSLAKETFNIYVTHEIKGKLSQSFKERFKNQEQERD